MRNQRVHYLALPSASDARIPEPLNPREKLQSTLPHIWMCAVLCGICMACYSRQSSLRFSTPNSNFCQLVGEYVAPASLLFGPKSQAHQQQQQHQRQPPHLWSSFLGARPLDSRQPNGKPCMGNGKAVAIAVAVAASLEWLLMSCSLMQFINVLKWPANQMHNVCLIPDLFGVCST